MGSWSTQGRHGILTLVTGAAVLDGHTDPLADGHATEARGHEPDR
jgi:hypothetical protein